MKCPVAALAVAAVLAAPAGAQNPLPRFSDPDRRVRLEKAFPEVEKIFEDFRAGHGAPGLAFGVVIDGELAIVKGLGVHDRKTQDAVTADTVFRIASMTKSFTAMAILKLRDEGRLSLEDPVSKWVPELARLRYPTRDTAPVRIRQLLTHGAGLPEDNPWGDRQLAAGEQLFTRWLAAGLPFSTPPDTAFEYSNYGFALLGRIVSRVSGVPYRVYLQKQILAPLGLRSATLEPAAVPPRLRATGYRKEGAEYMEEAPLADGTFGAMGGLLISARDLGRYVAFHLSAWPPRDEEDRGPVRRSSLREMQHLWRPSVFRAVRPSPDAPLRAVSSGYGYGLSVARDCRFERIVGHGGGLPGFGSYMVWLPEHGVGVFAMANLTYAGPSTAADDVLEALRRTGALRPRELPPSPALTSMRDAIVRLWQRWDQREAAAIAANNFFLDSPPEARRKQIDQIKVALGECRLGGEMRPQNLLRGEFRLTCQKGFVDAFFTLAPTLPPKLQYLAFTQAAALSETMKTMAESVAALFDDPSQDPLARISAASLDMAALGRNRAAVRHTYGSCRVGETLAGDGKTSATVRLECDRGPLDVVLRLDGDGRLSEVAFHSPPDAACAP